jgi:hypothetical protein
MMQIMTRKSKNVLLMFLTEISEKSVEQMVQMVHIGQMVQWV